MKKRIKLILEWDAGIYDYDEYKPSLDPNYNGWQETLQQADLLIQDLKIIDIKEENI